MDFPPNSQKARETEPRERIEPVTSAETHRRKNGLGRQFKETFFSGSGRDAASFMVEDVVVPTIRDMFHNALQAGLQRWIYGEGPRGPRRSYWSGSDHSPTGHVDYSRMSGSGPVTTQQRALSRQARAHHDFSEIVIPSLQAANTVIDRMYDMLSQYGYVSVADLLALVDIRPDHTDMKWGWTSLKGSRPVHVRKLDGYILDLPDPGELR